jgi:hypothetical protein
MPGVPERHSHDYVRNATANLHAALDLASGMTPRHRAEELRRFSEPDRRLSAGAHRRTSAA